MAVIMNGGWKNLYPQCVHNFCGFEKVNEESKEVFSNLMTLSKNLQLYLPEDNFTEDLMELEAQRKDNKTQEEGEVTEELNRFMVQEMAREFYLRRHC